MVFKGLRKKIKGGFRRTVENIRENRRIRQEERREEQDLRRKLRRIEIEAESKQRIKDARVVGTERVRQRTKERIKNIRQGRKGGTLNKILDNVQANTASAGGILGGGGIGGIVEPARTTKRTSRSVMQPSPVTSTTFSGILNGRGTGFPSVLGPTAQPKTTIRRAPRRRTTRRRKTRRAPRRRAAPKATVPSGGGFDMRPTITGRGFL